MKRIGLLVATVALIAGDPADAVAQRTDSARAGVAAPAQSAVADTSRKLPVSPRRAFVTSLILPGSMQLRFKRPKAAAIFLLAEAGSVGMSAKSWNDLRKAKNARKDTVGTPAVDVDGNPVLDPDTGEQVVNYTPRNPNLVGRIRARRAHLEDWLAVAVFNHLFAGADAYVAANLADFDANVQTTASERRIGFSARLAW